MRTINKHFWHRTHGRRGLRTSSYHIVISPHLLKQFSKIKLKIKYPPALLPSQLQNLCEKHRFADIEMLEYYNRLLAALNISLSGSQT